MSSAAADMKRTSEVTPCKTMRHPWHVSGVVHLSGGQRIITCSSDGSLRLWDLESSAQIGGQWQDEGGVGAATMALSPNGKTLASGSYGGTVRVWDIETKKVIAKWEGHTKSVESVCWSPDGEQVVSGLSDGTVGARDVESGEPEATMIATAGGHNENGDIKIWDAKTGKRLSIVTIDDVWSLTWTSDEKKLISGLSNGLIRIFNTATWQQIADLEGHGHEPVTSLTLFSNDRLLASTSWDQTARLWNLDTNLQVGSPLQHERDVTCAAFSPDGKLLSTGCIDNNAYVWDIQAILKTSGLEGLLSVPDAQKSKLKKKALSGTNATRRPPIRQVPAGFFDNVQGRDPVRYHRRTFALSWGSRPRALLESLSQLFRHSQTNTNKPIESRQRLGPSTSSRRSPPVVEVPALDDKKALYTARRPDRASDKAKRIKNPAWWARVVLFLCCASPSADSSH